MVHSPMEVSIKVQHLATIKELTISLNDLPSTLKQKIETLFSIPSSQQSLMLDGRNISTAAKPLGELGVREGALVIVRKMHKFQGQSKSMDLGSIMKNPMVKGMLKNPEMMKTLKDMFPDLEKEVEGNKTLSMMLQNGNMEEEFEKMANDADYMSSQLRNADVAMAKLENIPGGINMMSGMMKEAEDPFKALMSPGESTLKSGHKIDKRITTSLPGPSKKNYLVEFRKQIAELKELGFMNVEQNIRVLREVNGDIEAAVERLAEKKQ